MKVCSNCGFEAADAAVVCIKCGCSLENGPGQIGRAVESKDVPSAGFAVLGFFIPIVAAILILAWKNSRPRMALSCAMGIAINLVVSTIFMIITFLLSISSVIGLFESYM